MRHLQLVTPLLRSMLATVLVVCLVGVGQTASAGGWAVASLDALPTARSGESVAVGFTILQHGVSPVTELEDVGIEIVGSDGTRDFFRAAPDGQPGHFVANVTFPTDAGAYEWNVRMGWFGPQELGPLEIVGGTGAPGTTGGSVWPAVRWAMLSSTVLLAGVALADLARVRRRRAPAVP